MSYSLRKSKVSGKIATKGSLPPTTFTTKKLEQYRDEVMSGKIPVPEKNPFTRVVDDRQVGLRAIIRKSGTISYHAAYNIGESRPMLTVGHWPDTSIETARERTRVIQALARRGIDPQAGLHERLLEEIDRDGEKWRPTRRETADEILEKMLKVLGEHGIKVPAAVKTHIRSELK